MTKGGDKGLARKPEKPEGIHETEGTTWGRRSDKLVSNRVSSRESRRRSKRRENRGDGGRLKKTTVDREIRRAGVKLITVPGTESGFRRLIKRYASGSRPLRRANRPKRPDATVTSANGVKRAVFRRTASGAHLDVSKDVSLA